VVWREKLESGELENKLRLWRLLSRNTEEELPISRSISKTLKLSVLVMMDHASFGT
jgi:hypothetical protein